MAIDNSIYLADPTPISMAPKSICLYLVIITAFSFQSIAQLKPGDPDWPVVWTSYGGPVKSMEEDMQDIA